MQVQVLPFVPPNKKNLLTHDFFGDRQYLLLMETKYCNKCDRDKSVKDFNKNKSKKDGLASICKKCHKNYRHDHYVKNKDKVYEQVYTYREKNSKKTYDSAKKLNKKAGRTIPVKCASDNCENIVYASKKEIKDDVKKVCSRKCRNKTQGYCRFNRVLSDSRKRAKLKDWLFDLDKEFITDLLQNIQNNKCAITGVPIKFTEDTKIYETPSLDRIDSSKGYTKDNVQWVMLGVNYMKLNHSGDDLNKALSLIVEHYKT